MKKLFEPEVQKFLVRPDSWKYAEQSELNNSRHDGNIFYFAQLEKLQAFGIRIDGGGASHIAKGCTPSRAVFVCFWVVSGIEMLMRRGFDYYSAVQIIDWIVEVIINNKVHDERLKGRTERVFSALDFLELGERDTNMFYDKVLVGIRRVCGTIKYSREHHELLDKLVGNTPKQLSPMERKQLREKVLQGYDSHFRREANVWQKTWLNNACDTLAAKFGMFRATAVDFLKMVLIAARESYVNDVSCSPQQWKYRTQDMLTMMGLSLNEPGARKFFQDLIGDILGEISRDELDAVVMEANSAVFGR